MSAFKEQIQMYSIDQLQSMECEKLVELYNNGLAQLEEYSTKVINLRDNTTLIRQVICEKSNLKIEADDSDDDQIMTQENKKLPQKNQKVVKNDTNNEIEHLSTTAKSKVVKTTTDKPLAKVQAVKAPVAVKAPTKKAIIEPDEASESESEEVVEVEPVKKVTTNNKTSSVKKVEEVVKKVAPVKKTVSKVDEEPVKKVAPVKKTVTKTTTDDEDEVKDQSVKKVALVKKTVLKVHEEPVKKAAPVKKTVTKTTTDDEDEVKDQPVKKNKKVIKVVDQDTDEVSIVGNELENEKSSKKSQGQKKK